jgi:hypothetical protein
VESLAAVRERLILLRRTGRRDLHVGEVAEQCDVVVHDALQVVHHERLVLGLPVAVGVAHDDPAGAVGLHGRARQVPEVALVRLMEHEHVDVPSGVGALELLVEVHPVLSARHQTRLPAGSLRIGQCVVTAVETDAVARLRYAEMQSSSQNGPMYPMVPSPRGTVTH